MPVNIRGKQYITVSERVAAALATEDKYEMVTEEAFTLGDTGRWWLKVTILVGQRTYYGTAEIKFNAPKNTPDGATPLECAETSALGRALGYAGFGVVEGIATADELVRAQAEAAQDAASEPDAEPVVEEGAQEDAATALQMKMMRELCKRAGREIPTGKTYTIAQAQDIIHALNRELSKKGRRAS